MASVTIDDLSFWILAAIVATICLSIVLLGLKVILLRVRNRALKEAAAMELRERGFYSLYGGAGPIHICLSTASSKMPSTEKTVQSALEGMPPFIMSLLEWDDEKQDKAKTVFNSDVILWVGNTTEFELVSRMEPFRHELKIPTIVFVHVPRESAADDAIAVLQDLPHLPAAWFPYVNSRDLQEKVRDTFGTFLLSRRDGTSFGPDARTHWERSKRWGTSGQRLRDPLTGSAPNEAEANESTK